MRNLLLLFSVLLCFSCGNKIDMESILKNIVVEKAGPFEVKDYKSLSYEIDTVKVSDLKAFIEKTFPKKYFPKGVPSDFNDEQFEKFMQPLKVLKSDNDVAYLSVTHKYTVFNPMINKQVTLTQYRLLDPQTNEYKGEDLRKEKDWFGLEEYKMKKVEEELQNQNPNNLPTFGPSQQQKAVEEDF